MKREEELMAYFNEQFDNGLTVPKSAQNNFMLAAIKGMHWADENPTKPEVFTVSSRLQAAIDALELIEKSGYIPFTSPSPSSTEAEIKHAILRAHSELSHALKVHNRCYTLNGF